MTEKTTRNSPRRVRPLLTALGHRPIVVALGFAVLGILVLFWADLLFLKDINKTCGHHEFGCHATVELMVVLGGVAFASLWFTSWRVNQVARHYRKAAKKKTWDLVETKVAPEDGKVIGRGGVCETIIEHVRQPDSRPQLIVGGIGVGKTAVLVKLTELLADKKMIPVPICLRRARKELNFLDLAEEQFQKQIKEQLIHEYEGERIWNLLRQDGRVVVLADGLEEALKEDEAGRSRQIRLALQTARDVPLVITSRPDDALRGIDAAVIRLGPLEEDDVVDHLCEHASKKSAKKRIRTFAETADLGESPFYLHVARQLQRENANLAFAQDGGRLAIRVALLEQWTERFVVEKLPDEDRRIVGEERDRFIGRLAEMACAALTRNTIELKFEEYENSPLGRRRNGEVDPKFVARISERLDLLEEVSDGIRFRHSIMEAYLGARRLPHLLGTEGEVRERLMGTFFRHRRLSSTLVKAGRGSLIDGALTSSDLGRELLIALVMCCYRNSDDRLRKQVRDRLREEALSKKHRSTANSFDLLAAAYEIDRLLDGNGERDLGNATKQAWDPTSSRPAEFSVGNNRTVEAKLRAITRIGEAESTRAYRALWDVCLSEQNYRVRIHAAQTLGAGGSEAFSAIRKQIDSPRVYATRLLGGRAVVDAKQADVRHASVQGWILPMLAASCSRSDSRHVLHLLSEWIELVNQDLHLGVEACFAQGLKYEANRRHKVPAAVKERLIQLADRLLDASSWWHTKIAVVQALALWSLDEDTDRRGLRQRISVVSRKEGHPYVREAARLCVSVRASQLEEEPGKYIWIDEAGITANVGAKNARPSKSLWIPEAAGWLALDDRVRHRARQLVADTLVFLNLIEGSGVPVPDSERRDDSCRDREERRRHVRSQGFELPQCLGTGAGRNSLAVAGKASDQGGAGAAACSCGFDLCPYPKKGEPPFRGELNETFCRAQQRLMTKRRKSVPTWQEEGSFLMRYQGRKDLFGFWESMEDRAKEPIDAALDM